MNEFDFITEPGADPPSILSIAPGNQTCEIVVTAGWSGTVYIQRSTTSGSGFSSVMDSADPGWLTDTDGNGVYTDGGLTNGTVYYYRVVDDNGTGAEWVALPQEVHDAGGPTGPDPPFGTASLDTVIGLLPNLLGYWKLNELNGTALANQVAGGSAGVSSYNGTHWLAGPLYGITAGGPAFYTVAGLHTASFPVDDLIAAMFEDSTGDGGCIGFWFKLEAGGTITTDTWQDICAAVDNGAATGFWLEANNSSGSNGGFRLTAKTGSTTHQITWKRPWGKCPLFDTDWHHIYIRVKIVAGQTPDATELALFIDGIPQLFSSAWSDTATNGVAGSMSGSDFVLTLGAEYPAATKIWARYSSLFACGAGLTEREVLEVMLAGEYDGEMGLAATRVEFDLTRRDLMLQPNGTVVSAAGQSVRRVFPSYAANPLYTGWTLTAPTGYEPIWNGSGLEFRNMEGSFASPRMGMQLTQNANNPIWQMRATIAAVACPTAPVLANVTAPVMASLLGAGSSAFSVSVSATTGAPTIATGTVGTYRDPSSYASTLQTPKSLPSGSLIVGSSGVNGSGAEGDATDFCYVVDGSVRSRTTGAATAANGNWGNQLASGGWIGCSNPATAHGDAFAGIYKRICFANRPINTGAEAPFMFGKARFRHPVLGRNDRPWVLILGDSISAGQESSDPIGGWQTKVTAWADNAVVVNLSIGGYTLTQMATRVDSSFWTRGRGTDNPLRIFIMLGTNDITTTAGPPTQATQTELQERFYKGDGTGLIEVVRTRFGSNVPITIILPRSNLSNALSPAASSATLKTWLLAHPDYYTCLLDPGEYSAVDGIHPDDDGHAEIADEINTSNCLRDTGGTGEGFPEDGRIRWLEDDHDPGC